MNALAGIDSGELQRLQSNLTKWAAMAAMLCASAGWWQLEALLSSLSAQAAAGAKPEFLPLMRVSSYGPEETAQDSVWMHKGCSTASTVW